LEIDGLGERSAFVVEDESWFSRIDGLRDARTGLFVEELLLVEEDAERLWVGRGVA
jgi:hypothetical protein